MFLGLHRCLLILRSTFHGVAQKYGWKPQNCPSGLVLVNGKSCKFLKVSPTLQRRPRKGQLKRWDPRAWPGESSAASYGPMRCLLWIIINFEAIFLAEKCQFWPILVEMGPKSNLILICSCIFCTQPEPYLYCAPVCNTGPQPVLFAS